MVWYNVIWYYVLWCDMICDMIYDMIYDVIWHDVMWYMWYDIWYDVMWYMWYMTWCDMMYDMWYDVIYMIWYDVIWYDVIWYMIWCDVYDMIYDIRYDVMWYDMIYLLTAIGLPPGGSSTVHIYTQTIHRTTQSTQTIRRTTQFTYTTQLTNQQNSLIQHISLIWSIDRIAVDRGYPKYSERETCPKTTLSTTYPTWTYAGIKFWAFAVKSHEVALGQDSLRVFRFSHANRHSTSVTFPFICHPAPLQYDSQEP